MAEFPLRPLEAEHRELLAMIQDVGSAEAMKRWDESEHEERALSLALLLLEHIGEPVPDWWIMGGSGGGSIRKDEQRHHEPPKTPSEPSDDQGPAEDGES